MPGWGRWRKPVALLRSRAFVSPVAVSPEDEDLADAVLAILSDEPALMRRPCGS